MRVVADSHAIVWYGHDSPSLSGRARDTLDQAMESDGVVISIVTLVELWYVTQTTRAVSQDELDAIREQVSSSPTMDFPYHLLPHRPSYPGAPRNLRCAGHS